MNEEYLCDEEKSYNEWVAKNLSYISKHKQSIEVMRKLYMDGFAAGFVHRDKINAAEQLQK
jgi:hypothetical protein